MKYVYLFGLYLAALPGMIPIEILMIIIYYHDGVDDGDQRCYYIYICIYIYNIYVPLCSFYNDNDDPKVTKPQQKKSHQPVMIHK